jgi:hypothetical protein
MRLEGSRKVCVCAGVSLVRALRFELLLGDMILCVPSGIEEMHNTSETDVASMTD